VVDRGPNDNSCVRRNHYEKEFQRGRGLYQVRSSPERIFLGYGLPGTSVNGSSFLLPARASGWPSYDNRPVK
jgi:hypothetical protein